jgi:hypothetical protein
METPLPYGTPDLDPKVHLDRGPPLRVRCYVKGCSRMLRPPSRGCPGELCPVHEIRCHYSRSGVTYSYENVRRNIIVAPSLLADRVVGHPFKHDSSRFGLEKSEDALTWNVFRSLQEAGCLREVARMVTGLEVAEEPLLFLWGLCQTGDTLEPWNLLVQARKHFESDLPVKRPLTEPDIGLYLPGHYLILIEAKFTGENPFYRDGSRRDDTSLTKDELLNIYQFSEMQILDMEVAKRANQVYYQLWRNTVFAEWMVLADGRGTRAWHVNLTREGYEADSCGNFREMLRPGHGDRFLHVTWEKIFNLSMRIARLGRLRDYLGKKTAGLVQAFKNTSEAEQSSL